MSTTTTPSTPSTSDDVREFVRRNKLRVIGSIWFVGIVSAFAMQHRGARGRRTATSVKIIHSRLYAQFATVSALVIGAGVEMMSRATTPSTPSTTTTGERALEYAFTHGARAARRRE